MDYISNCNFEGEIIKYLQVRTNVSGALNSLGYICRAIASWHVIFAANNLAFERLLQLFSSSLILSVSQVMTSEDLHNEVCQILLGYKQVCFISFGSLWFKILDDGDHIVTNR